MGRAAFLVKPHNCVEFSKEDSVMLFNLLNSSQGPTVCHSGCLLAIQKKAMGVSGIR